MKNVLYNMGNMKMGGMSMNCMKCGRELSGDGVFCAECLAEMENYPVKPGTVVHLPRRKQEQMIRKPQSRRKNNISPEEQMKQLRKVVRRLILALVLSLALLGATGYFAVVHLLEGDVVLLPGQNYSSVETVPQETEN